MTRHLLRQRRHSPYIARRSAVVNSRSVMAPCGASLLYMILLATSSIPARAAEQPATQGDLKSERFWLDRAMVTAERIADPQQKGYVLQEIAESRAAVGDVAEALRIADAIADDSWKGYALAAITSEQLKFGDLAGARRIAAIISPDFQKINVLTGIARAEAASGDVEAALKTLNGIGDNDAIGLAVDDIARTLAKDGDFSGAIRLARAVGDTKAKSDALSSIAKIQIKAGKFSDARRTIEAIPAPENKFMAFFELFGELLDSGNVAEATEALQAADVASRQIKDTPKGGDLDFRGFVALWIRAFTGEVNDAKRAAMALEDEKERDEMLGAIVYRQALTDDLAGARETAASITAATGKSGALAVIAEAQADAGDVSGAIATATASGEEWPEGSAGNAIARAQAKAGDAAGARTTAGAMKDERRRRDALQAVAETQANAGDVAGAVETLKLLDPDDPESSWLVMALNDLLPKLIESGDLAGAVEAADAYPGPRDKAQNLAAISEAQMKSGHAAAARLTAQAARQTADAIPADENASLSADCLGSVGRAQAYAGDVVRACTWIDALPDLYQRAHAELGVARGLMRRNQETAVRVRKSADAGDAEAQFVLGLMYSRGRGVVKDETQSTDWIGKSLKQNYAPAREWSAARAELEQAGSDLAQKKADLRAAKEEAAKTEKELEALKKMEEYLRAEAQKAGGAKD